MLRADHFGNLILDASRAQLIARSAMRLGDDGVGGGVRETFTQARYVSTFADVAPGELLLYEDAQRMVALAVNRGSAAERCCRRDGATVRAA